MYHIALTPDEEHVLEQTFKTTPDRRLRDRCQAVLMAARGRARHRIAQDLGVHRTTLQLWLRGYRERGVQGLKLQWAPGPPRRIPAALAPTIVAEGIKSLGIASHAGSSKLYGQKLQRGRGRHEGKGAAGHLCGR